MSEVDVPLFRAPKRRKTVTTFKPPPSSDQQTDSNLPVEDEDDTTTPSPFVKPRTQIRGKPKFSGIQFSNTVSRQPGDNARDEDSMALIAAPDHGESSAGTITHGLNTRFVGSGMGIGRDPMRNDPNITAYIDAEVARRREVQTQTQRDIHLPSSTYPTKPLPSVTTAEKNTQADQDAADLNSDIQITSTSKKPGKTHGAGTGTGTGTGAHHHLAEIDLSSLPAPPSRENQALPPRKKKPKVRLGRDGKPYRPRPRPGPNPEDIAREQLVEQILNEGRDPSAPEKRHDSRGVAANTARTGKGGDEGADERMEREFTREFLERQQVSSAGGGGGRSAETKTGAAKDAAATGPAAVLSSGPRLGGSRSARARMVAALEKEREKEKEGK